jgi:hypothetical protein
VHLVTPTLRQGKEGHIASIGDIFIGLLLVAFSSFFFAVCRSVSVVCSSKCPLILTKLNYCPQFQLQACVCVYSSFRRAACCYLSD